MKITALRSFGISRAASGRSIIMSIQMKDRKRCKTCKYRTSDFRQTHMTAMCNYLAITGHSRMIQELADGSYGSSHCNYYERGAFIPPEKKPMVVSHCSARRVAQCDPKTGEIISVYDSMAMAQKATGINIRHISNCIHGRQKTASGYIWKRIREESTCTT
jgi:hypothetical protein